MTQAKIPNSELAAWLEEKIDRAHKDLRARIQSEATWRSGSDREWIMVGSPMNRVERLRMAEQEARIVIKCRRELERFQAIYEDFRRNNDC